MEVIEVDMEGALKYNEKNMAINVGIVRNGNRTRRKKHDYDSFTGSANPG